MKDKVKHMVIFRFKPSVEQAQINSFIMEAKRLLTQIPVVQDFEVLKEISNKNNFQYGFAMEFNRQKEYDAYIGHPFHQSFLSTYWNELIEEYMEMDFHLS